MTAAPDDDTHTIVVRITPTTHDRMAIATNSTHPDPKWTARALRLAAEAVLIEEDGPAITTSGHLVERHTTR
jgi:hypothetical protein